MDLQLQVAIGDFPVWLDLSLFPCLLLGSVARGQESERLWPVLWGKGDEDRGCGGPVQLEGGVEHTLFGILKLSLNSPAVTQVLQCCNPVTLVSVQASSSPGQRLTAGPVQARRCWLRYKKADTLWRFYFKLMK